MLSVLKKKKVWIPLVLIVLIIAGFLSRSRDEIIIVETETVKRTDIIHKVNASGRIQPEQEVQITSTITGWITEITVLEGDTVHPGQHLISIDEKQYRPRYNQALSQVKSSEANLRKVQSQMGRTKSLFSQKLISEQELEQIEASYQMAVSQSEQANANLLSAEDELSKTRLMAPKYGIVTSLTKEVGEMAVGGMFNPGVLMTVADLSRMEVEVDVNENDVVNIDIGDTSEIEIDALPDTVFYGVVSEIAHTAQSLNMGSQQQVTLANVTLSATDAAIIHVSNSLNANLSLQNSIVQAANAQPTLQVEGNSSLTSVIQNSTLAGLILIDNTDAGHNFAPYKIASGAFFEPDTLDAFSYVFGLVRCH